MKEDALKRGERVALYGTIFTGVLAVIKYSAGEASGNVSLKADAIHTSANLLTIAAAYFGLHIAKRGENERFPYGYYKAETITTLFISFVIIALGANVGHEAYTHLSRTPTLQYGYLAMGTALFASAGAFLIYMYEAKAGKELNSQSLTVNAKEALADTVSSLIVFASVILSYFKIPYLPAIIGLIIAAMVIGIGITAAKTSILVLMDSGVDPNLLLDIRESLYSVRGVLDIRIIKLRRSGPFIIAESTVGISADLRLEDAYTIAKTAEETVKKEFPEVIAVHIEMVPAEMGRMRVAVPVVSNEGNPAVNPDTCNAPYFYLATMRKDGKGEIIEEGFIRSPPVKDEYLAGPANVHVLIKNGVDVLLTKKIDERILQSITEAGLTVHYIKKKRVKEAVKEYFEGIDESSEVNDKRAQKAVI